MSKEVHHGHASANSPQFICAAKFERPADTLQHPVTRNFWALADSLHVLSPAKTLKFLKYMFKTKPLGKTVKALKLRLTNEQMMRMLFTIMNRPGVVSSEADMVKHRLSEHTVHFHNHW